MKILKYIGGFIAVVVLLFLFVSNFSVAKSNYKCVGTINFEGSSKPATIFIKLNAYRWWVGIWSDSDASLNLEIPNTAVDYYEHLVEVGDQLQIYKKNPTKLLKGNFSKLSKTLSLDTAFGFFDGSCSVVE